MIHSTKSLNYILKNINYENKITIIDRQHKMTSFALKDKKAVAKDIVQAIIEKFHA